ncbi:hypothetical protein ABMA27_001341 [Loxostege sticticalis]|uniref:FLYWCH-type domain-containing protein n=1 Tax=Loxostege sticticalis TaxID=481309 RepID=A0ABR3HYD1_LOXSC
MTWHDHCWTHSNKSKNHQNRSSRAFFSTTSRGARIICLGGYKFTKQYKVKYKTRWWCGSSRACPAVVYTIDDKIVSCKHKHNHPPPTTL